MFIGKNSEIGLNAFYDTRSIPFFRLRKVLE